MANGQGNGNGESMWWMEIPKGLRWVTHLTGLGFVIILAAYLVWQMTGRQQHITEQTAMDVAHILDKFEQHIKDDEKEVHLLRAICAMNARQAKDGATERECWGIQ